MKNIEQIKKILTFLEEKVDKDLKEAPKRIAQKRPNQMELDEIKMIAKKHLVLEKKIAALNEELDKLHAENEPIREQLIDQCSRFKNKTIRLGELIVMVEETVRSGRPSRSYKGIVDAITEAYTFEKGFISRLMKKYSKSGTDSIDQDLIVGNANTVSKSKNQRDKFAYESVQKLVKQLEETSGHKVALKEGFGSFLISLGQKAVAFFKSSFAMFSHKVDSIEKQVMAFQNDNI